MAVACSVKKTARLFAPLRTNPAINRLLGASLHSLALQHVTSRLPAGMVQEVDEPENPRYGWLDKNGITINTARPVRADTPLHELTHLWLLMLRTGQGTQESQRYQQLSQQLSQDPAFQALARSYPLSADYRASDQTEEVAAMLVGQLAARRLRLQQVPIVGKLLASVEKLVGRYLGLEGQVLTQPLHKIISALADDILSSAPLDVDPDWITSQVQYARNQGVDIPANTRELLTRLSQRGGGLDTKQLRAKATYGLSQVAAGDTTLRLPNPLGGPMLTPDVSHLDLAGREDYVLEHYRQMEAANTSLAGDGAMVLLGLPAADLAAVLSGDYRKLPAHREYTEKNLQALALQLRNAFYDVQPQDTIVPYSASSPGIGEHYHPEFDDGLTMVHLKPRKTADGKTVTEAVLVRLMSNAPGSKDADLTNKKDDRPLLSGLYSGSWGDVAKGWAIKRFFGLTMTASTRNRSLLGSSALAMHLTERGLRVTGVGVAKIDMQSTPEMQENDVRLVPISEYLEAWKALSKVNDVQALLGPRLKELLGSEKLLASATYEQDYLRTLAHYSEGKKDLAAIGLALGEYEATERQNSARGLIRSIENRLQELTRFYGKNKDAFYKNQEVIVLGQARVQLQGIMMLANKHADLGSFQQFVRSFNAGDNPILQWFYEQWRTAREATTNKFLAYQSQRIDKVEDLIADYHRRHGSMINVFSHDEGKYYRELFHESEQTYVDKDGKTRSTVVSEYRFKMPGTPEFDKPENQGGLSDAQRSFITWTLATMKTASIDRYLQANSNGREPTAKQQEAANKWYEKNWGQGYAPIITGDVTQVGLASVKSGEYESQLLERITNQLDENYTYDQQANQNQDTLSDRFGMQAGASQHGSASRLQALGLMSTIGRDPVTGKEKIVYVLDPAGGRARNLGLEPDFRRTLDQFMMSTYKHMQATDLQTKKLTAVALLRAGFRQSGELRGQQEDGQDSGPAENDSLAERNLDKMYRLLVLGQRNQMKQSEAVRRLGAALMGAGKVASMAALGFSLGTAASSQLSNIFNAVDVGIANWGQENGLSLPTMTRALKEFAHPGKLWAMAKLQRTLDMDEHSLLEDRMQNGMGKQDLKATDILSGKESFVLDRFGDMAVRLWLTASQMMQDGSWEAYDWNEKTGTLTFNESKLRELKGNAYVDAIRRRQLETGELGLDEQGNPLPMTSSHDDRLRGSIEAWNTEVLGGYAEEVGTTMATNIFLRSLQKFRVYAVKRIDDWTKEERSNTNQGYYDATTAQWVSREEVGVFTSIAKMVGGIGLNRGNPVTTWQQMSAADHYNLRRVAMGSLTTVAGMLLMNLIWGDDDEEKKRRAANGGGKQQRGIAEKALNSLVHDQFLLYQMGAVKEAVLSPLIAFSFVDRMAAGMGSYLSGDFDAGNRVMVRNIGVLKTADWVRHVFFDADRR